MQPPGQGSGAGLDNTTVRDADAACMPRAVNALTKQSTTRKHKDCSRMPVTEGSIPLADLECFAVSQGLRSR